MQLKKIRKYLNAIGLFEKERELKPVPTEDYSYAEQDDEAKSLAHMQYLKSLMDGEDSRLVLIESKSSQLIGQTGLIFSLLSLFVPLLIDKVDGLSFSLKSTLLIILLFAFGFYLLTIRNALKNYNVRKFQYSSPAPRNVLEFRDKPLSNFYSEVIRDLLYGLHRNNEINNNKASNLLQSYLTFRIANWLTGLLVVFFCITLLFRNPDKQNVVTISNPVKVEHFDTLINLERLRKSPPPKVDSRNIKSQH